VREREKPQSTEGSNAQQAFSAKLPPGLGLHAGHRPRGQPACKEGHQDDERALAGELASSPQTERRVGRGVRDRDQGQQRAEERDDRATIEVAAREQRCREDDDDARVGDTVRARQRHSSTTRACDKKARAHGVELRSVAHLGAGSPQLAERQQEIERGDHV